MLQSLCGEWKFRELHNGEWMPATVPGCNYLDLMANGTIADPFYKTNEKDVYWVAQKDWEYQRTFTLRAEDLQCDRVELCADMLDTICSVFVNEVCIASPENCHIGYCFDVTHTVHEGENSVRVVFTSPVNYVTEKQKLEKCPRNANGQDGIPHIRKPQCHFGWDWGPVLPPSGISGNIFLRFLHTAKIEDVYIEQRHYDGKVDVTVQTEAALYGNTGCTARVTLTAPNGEEMTAEGDRVTFTVENPELWWTYDITPNRTPALYTVTVQLLARGKPIDESIKAIGLRTIELNREKDQYGSNFQFVLNGVPLFIKGANYIPPDSFINRFTEEKLRYMLDAMQFSNMNMIRIWGGGYYGSDALFDMCDRMGILVWQDFPFACQPYPFFDDALLENIKAEVHYNVTRLRHHASLAIWCGNNEIEAMSAGWITRRNYVEWTEKFFYTILEPQLRLYDPTTAYIPGSPCGLAHNNGVEADNVGDTHLWAVWHGLQPMTYYRGRLTRFCSEFGFESLPDIKTIQTFADPADYDLASEVFTAHQKCESGNEKMIYYIASRFHLPKKFEDFIYLSQVAQQECISDATEHWRRNKGRCNGAMYWQLNDCWPVCSWAGMDYYGNYKALQYTARRFNAPISVSIEDGKEKTRIVAINDTVKNRNLIVRYKLFDFVEGVKSSGEVSVFLCAVENKEIFVFDMAKLRKKFNLKHTGLLAELLCDGEVISRKTVLFDKEKRLKLPPATLRKTAEIKEDCIEFTLTTDVFARLVRIESLISTLPFSDNYFDLLPGEEMKITMPLDPSVSPQEQAEQTTLFCCTDVESDRNSLAERLTMAKIFVKPVNISNFIYRSLPNKDGKTE